MLPMIDTNNFDGLGLRSFLILLLDNLYFIVGFTTILTGVSIIYSLLATPIYEATAAMTHSSTMTRSQSTSSSIDDIANLVQTGSVARAGTVSPEEKLAIERITSKNYFRRIYNNPVLLSCLYEECDLSNFDINTFDLEVYENENKNFVSYKPQFMKAYRKFRGSFSIFPNVTLTHFSYKHFSAQTAYNFLNWIVIDSNNYIRDHEVNRANKTIDFLSGTLSSKKNIEVQKLVAALMQKEIQTLALSEKTDYFAFEIVDSPYVPEDRIFPKRSLIVITSFLISIFLSISILVLEKVFKIRSFFRSLEIRKRIFRS
jgi:LPS O-antigen subunit length determinant protein (WzzB/FepE family)